MKEILFIYSPSSRVCKKLIRNDEFIQLLQDLRKFISVKTYRIVDQRDQKIIENAGLKRVPALRFEEAGIMQDYEGLSVVVKTLTELKRNLERNAVQNVEQQVMEMLDDNVYFVSCENYVRIPKTTLRMLRILVDSHCAALANEMLPMSPSKIVETLSSRQDEQKYLVVTSSRSVADRYLADSLHVSGPSSFALNNKHVSIEKIANEYKEAQRDYLTRNSVTIIPK
jgi:hypothetical protein